MMAHIVRPIIACLWPSDCPVNGWLAADRQMANGDGKTQKNGWKRYELAKKKASLVDKVVNEWRAGVKHSAWRIDVEPSNR